MGEPHARTVWELVALGTGGLGCFDARGYPAVLLKTGSHRTLLDAGDGALRQLAHWDGSRPLAVVVLMALTVERVGGLPTVLACHAVRRWQPPLLVGPRGTSRVVEDISRTLPPVGRSPDIIEVDSEYAYDIGLAQLTFRVIDEGAHGASLGVRLTEPNTPGRFDMVAAERLGLKPGPDFGRLQRGEPVAGVKPSDVIGPPRLGRTLALLGPCRPTDAALEMSRGAGIVFIDAPYTEERHDVAVETSMMTGVEAAVLASAASSKTLALCHLGSAVRPGYARREAAQFHDAVVVPGDGDRFTMPLSDDNRVERTRVSA